MRKREVKAVLFDLDGVLVDSIGAWFYVFNDTLKLFGKTAMPRRQFARIFGMSIDRASRLYFGSADIKQVEHAYNNFFEKRLRNIRIFKSTAPALGKIKKTGIKTALITNSQKTLVHKILRKFKLVKYFDAIVTMDDVRHGKPSPELVFKACRKLKVSPANAVLVGDTKNDMLAGKRAGCITIGYRINGDYKINRLSSMTKFIK